MEHKDDLDRALRERQPAPSSQGGYKHPKPERLAADSGRSGSPEALEKIVRYFKRVNRPLYTGNVSVEVGFNLRQTELMLRVLEGQGTIRILDARELRSLGIDDGGEVWIMGKKAA